MDKHFDYFHFPRVMVVVYCDEQDKILGYFALTNGNELGQLYVDPKCRKTEVVHTLLREAMAIVHAFGFPYIWGVCYERMKRFYEFFNRNDRYHKLPLEFLPMPLGRKDGQYIVRMWFEEEKDGNGSKENSNG